MGMVKIQLKVEIIGSQVFTPKISMDRDAVHRLNDSGRYLKNIS